MRLRGCGHIAIALMLCAAVSASAAPTKRRAAVHASSNAPHLASLVVEPAHVALTGPLNSQHLLITGRFSDGSEIDLTRAAVCKPAKPGVVRIDHDVVAPVGNGTVDLLVRADGQTAHIPATVRDFEKTAPVSLTNDIEPILTRIGCNQGTCHGQQNGKGGFKLSLRGYDSGFDFEQITKDAGGKRVDLKSPEKSLILLKPTMEVPHGGGPRLTKGSQEYNLILRWLREGRVAPSDKEPKLAELRVSPAERVLPKPGMVQPILAIAKYSDGSERDVTSLCRFSSQNDAVASVTDGGAVTVRQPGESAIMVSYGGEVKVTRVLVPQSAPPLDVAHLPRANFIDGLVYAKLAKMRIPPSGRCTDAEFL